MQKIQWKKAFFLVGTWVLITMIVGTIDQNFYIRDFDLWKSFIVITLALLLTIGGYYKYWQILPLLVTAIWFAMIPSLIFLSKIVSMRIDDIAFILALASSFSLYIFSVWMVVTGSILLVKKQRKKIGVLNIILGICICTGAYSLFNNPNLFRM